MDIDLSNTDSSVVTTASNNPSAVLFADQPNPLNAPNNRPMEWDFGNALFGDSAQS